MRKEFTPEGEAVFPEPSVTSKDRERWSRLIGALGEGAWRRLRSLRICLVGIGRTGSLIAMSLARQGISRVALIDPDQLELNNLDAMNGVGEKDVGRLKVSGVRDAAIAISGCDEETQPLPESITTLRAFVVAKEADILISCVDDDGARLAASIIATLYAKPLLDIGTGIFGTGEERQMGGDIRLMLPGERCLLCMGGLASPDQGRTIFNADNGSVRRRPSWREERAGSLRSLNQIAAHLGLRLLEDFVGERVGSSTWLHLEVDRNGLPSIQRVAPARADDCPLCRRMGEGDEGISRVRDLRLILSGNAGTLQDN